ncbi:AraC family transcriptional regulator [Tumebacillus algifaecis]|uniref:AraC family transcriptional regulator n=1 Tax=Tumebacillus algifaecis TaxID=1214604 RepID=A0A223CWI7_9BACL|nr:helix-turn-helix domain-containing protein [Tumebacillus algifaecis]ASS73686.1 AraC family transcriptional regulator [Tumebacillus algifaecis]
MSLLEPKPSMGVLKLYDSEKNNRFRLHRYPPAEDLRFFIKHFWIVSWDLTDQEPFWQHVVPNPCVNLVIEHGKSGIFGPAKQKFSYQLQGIGCVFGVKFKPGGFYPFLQRSVAELSKQPLNISDVFAVDACALEQAILTETEEEKMVELASAFIRHKLPKQDATILQIDRVIDRIIHNHEITKVDQLCDALAINKRKLQRLFEQYVGVSPKWVIKLYRLQNAAAMIERDHRPDLLQLSLALGYYDQSHFNKDFKMIIGKTPLEYARPTVPGQSTPAPQPQTER